MIRIYSFILFFSFSTLLYAQKEEGLKAITMNSIQSQLYFLAGDLMQGRQAGSSSGALTAEYLASELGCLGLKPFDLSKRNILEKYMQPFTAIRYTAPKCEISISQTEYTSLFFKEGIDFHCKNSTLQGIIKAPIVNYDHTANHKGLIVLYKGSKQSEVIAAAREQGASAILIYDPYYREKSINENASTHHYNESIYEGTTPRELFSDSYMVLDNGDTSVPLLEININETLYNHLYNTGVREMTITITNTPQRVYLRNVLGMIEGSKPDEFVIIGAHFDHLGMQGGYIYNGADDNASGVVAVLQIAKAFVAAKEKPRKTVIFALWDGEEYGLLGSKYFTANFSYLKDVKGYMNFDMIGRNTNENKPKHLVYFYTASQPKYEKWMKEHIEQHKLELEPHYNAWDNPVGGSDNASFARHNIPIIWYHTNGHPDYHQPTDHADKINWSKLIDIIKSAYLNFYNMAND